MTVRPPGQQREQQPDQQGLQARPTPLISLVLATYGRADVLERLIASLCHQTFDDFEVIVADQNRDDRVDGMIAPLVAAGRLGAHIRMDQPNLSRARNAGLAAAKGRLVGFPDDDCWYEPDTLARVADQFRANAGLAGIAARWAEAPPEPGDAEPVISRAAMRRFRGGNVASITLFLVVGAVREAGGFDERIGVGRWFGAGEETDLVLTLVERNLLLRHAPDVIVHHALVASRSTLPLTSTWRQSRTRARGTGALYAKHRLPAWVIARGLMAPLLAVPGPDLAAGLATSIGRLEGLLGWPRAGQKTTPDDSTAPERKPGRPV